MKLVETHNKFVKHNLDVLFVALNPATQSNDNGHYFSGKSSLFFKILYKSGLVKKDLMDRKTIDADEIIFNSTIYNYHNKKFGVIDVVKDIANSQGKYVSISDDSYNQFIDDLIYYSPKNVVIIISKVAQKINSKEKIILKYGNNGKTLSMLGIQANIFLCPFPNGTSYTQNEVVKHYARIKEVL